MRPRVTMPKWPAWLMAIAGAACAYPAISNEPSPRAEQELYQAHGSKPDWSLTIHYGRIDYEGDKGAQLSVLRPDPRPSLNGRRYVTPQLVVDLSGGRCTDPASGKGYEHQVLVIAGGRAVKGCGGARRPQWDRRLSA
ncbi:MAG TPA: hypothetical protein VH331_09570 [Allosphingosinicella sp.]|jgi:uncharacterized membrane protein|nr:hypothetical protein [Allosphingosinicella sp.]